MAKIIIAPSEVQTYRNAMISVFKHYRDISIEEATAFVDSKLVEDALSKIHQDGSIEVTLPEQYMTFFFNRVNDKAATWAKVVRGFEKVTSFVTELVPGLKDLFSDFRETVSVLEACQEGGTKEEIDDRIVQRLAKDNMYERRRLISNKYDKLESAILHEISFNAESGEALTAGKLTAWIGTEYTKFLCVMLHLEHAEVVARGLMRLVDNGVVKINEDLTMPQNSTIFLVK